MEDLAVIIGILKIVIVLGTLVTIHELGHFVVAKACNIKVLKFAIGFGPKVWRKKKKETEYSIRLFPFGGFVQMDGEDIRSDDERAFNKKPIYQRVLVVAAGAVVNIIFAVLLYTLVAMSTNNYLSTKIKDVPTNSSEYIAGLRVGDTILKVNNKKTLVYYDVTSIIEKSNEDVFDFVVLRDGELEEIKVDLPVEEYGFFGIAYDENAIVLETVADSPAYQAGVLLGDKVLKVNGNEIAKSTEISEIISKYPNQEIKLEILRDGEILEISGVAGSRKDRHYNIAVEIYSPERFLKKVQYAINETGDYFYETIKGIATLITGKAQNVQVMGPVGIADEITKTNGWNEFFYMMSAISLSLGIFNLFPIPGLDGGKIVLLIIEAIRRKPLSEKVEGTMVLIGFALLIILSIIVTVFDVVGLF